MAVLIFIKNREFLVFNIKFTVKFVSLKAAKLLRCYHSLTFRHLKDTNLSITRSISIAWAISLSIHKSTWLYNRSCPILERIYLGVLMSISSEESLSKNCQHLTLSYFENIVRSNTSKVGNDGLPLHFTNLRKRSSTFQEANVSLVLAIFHLDDMQLSLHRFDF